MKYDHLTSYPRILEHVKNVGSDNLNIFSGNFQGGYYLQQIPEEVTGLICYLLENNLSNFANFLEIGSAAGGFIKLLSEFINISSYYIIDDNQLQISKLRKTLLRDLKPTEFIGDSHSSKCRRTLQKWGKKFDLVHIDGDHSYNGIQEDTFTVRRVLQDRSHVIFHDVATIPDVARWNNELIRGAMPEFTLIRSFINPRSPKLGINLFRFERDPALSL